MITRLDAWQAAKNIRDLRSGHLPVHESIEWKGAKAELFHDVDKLVVALSETDQRSDWRRYNLPFWPTIGGGEKHWWHRGFYRYATALYGFVKATRPDRIISYSLGAAAGQIIGSSLGIPTIGIAAPRTLWQPFRANEIEGEHLVHLFNGTGDLVTKVPPSWLGFHHVGHRHRVACDEHSPIERYVDALEPKR